MMLLCKLTRYTYLLILLVAFTSCNGQSRAPAAVDNTYLQGSIAPASENIRCIYQDSKGIMWFGSDGSGLYRYDGKKLLQLTEKDGLPNNQVRTIQEDSNGNIWLETGMGICFYNGSFFKALNVNDTTVVKRPSGAWQKQTGSLWFAAGAFKGVYTLSDGDVHNYRFPEAERKGHNASSAYDEYDVYCIYTDRDGNVWFGTQVNGVCRFDGKNFTWLKDKGLDGAAVRTIYQDKAGNMWFGNNGYGLFRYNGKTLVNVTEEKGLGNPEFLKKLDGREGTLARVWAIDEDSAGNLWIGTVDAGVWRYDDKKMTNYTGKQGLKDISVTAVYKDKRGVLWLGTAGATYRLDDSLFVKAEF